ncbi:flavin-containing monooxygenase [Nocardia salmonicida]|uniref:flavin-containing monooxygenase n=1 Tax=Nocardia salmonicida TaxID=53431 RepID=UPI0007A450F5|nr:NAD(P)/FAD-dependent oxidoreductase [Nocardia salmonicida]
MTDTPIHSVVVVGAGFGGLTMAAELTSAGVEDFLILEEGPEVGGVWRENTYPGAACDVPSHLYSFAHDPHRDPRIRYPDQESILAYMREVTDRHGLREHLRCNTSVAAADYGEDGTWTLTTTGRQVLRTRAVVWAVGQLHRPSMPYIDGAETFAGAAVHSARWDHTVDLTGQIAVIGTGCSAAQMIPELARTAAGVTVYQRTPAWVLPKPDAQFGPVSRWALAHVPGLHALYRAGVYRGADLVLAPIMRGGWSARPAALLARAHLRRQVRDRELRRKLTPAYRIGEKRILMDSGLYPALTQPHVELVTDPIEAITPTGIRTADGTERAADLVVWATGFRTLDFFSGVEIRGRDGLELRALWQQQGRPSAFYGTAVPGFPGLYMIAGPNAFTPSNSNPSMKLHQARYIMRCLDLSDRVGAPVEVSEQAMAAYLDRLDRALARTVWRDGVHTWWKQADGTTTNAWPGTVAEFGRALQQHEPDDSFRIVAPARQYGLAFDRQVS